MALTNEDLLAISQLLDVKLDAKLKPMENDIKSIKDEQTRIKDEQTRINLIIENDILHDINILVENYVPAAKRYQDATSQIEAMKKVISDHSEKLKKIS